MLCPRCRVVQEGEAEEPPCVANCSPTALPRLLLGPNKRVQAQLLARSLPTAATSLAEAGHCFPRALPGPGEDAQAGRSVLALGLY